jgi:hypothetical protein
MSHFAQLDQNNMVIQVLVAEQDFINSGVVGDPARWIQTSYNTYGGQHRLGGTPLRKNYAGLGFRYDVERDAFIPPKPYASWVLDEASCLWQAPVAMPTDGKAYRWNDQTQTWDEFQPLNA